MRSLVAVAAALLLGAAPASGAIVRGPLLGVVTQDSITVRWFTDDVSVGTVHYGLEPFVLTDTVTESEATTDHEVVLTGLTPSTRYFYAVSSGTDTVSGAELFFTTAPTPCEPFRFAVFGDSRGATPFCDNFTDWSDVAQLMDEQGPELVIGTGDYTFSGEKSACWDHWFSSSSTLWRHTPFFPAIGNHDYDTQKYTNESNQGLLNFARWFSLPDGPQVGFFTTYYAFTFGNARFIVFDNYKDLSPGSAQLIWIESELAAAFDHPDLQHVFVIDHATFHGVGSFCVIGEQAQETNRTVVEPLLEHYQIDATFVGHEHSYQRSVKNGIHHLVIGGGGSPLENTLLNCDMAYCSWDRDYLVRYDGCTFHSLVVDVDGAHVTYRVLGTDGATVLDQWEADHWTEKYPTCVPANVGEDAGVADASLVDAPATDGSEPLPSIDATGNPLADPAGGDCGCRAGRGRLSGLLLWGLLGLALLRRRRRHQ